MRGRKRAKTTNGFTLIEMSIMLVIIGLIVGGVLVGRDLIKAAEVRAQVSQVEQYQRAVATFYGKYQALPGDMNAAAAAQFGFVARGGAGQGDGNGIIQGCNVGGSPSCTIGYGQTNGETVVFWVDLSAAGLIDQSFNLASETVAQCQYAAAAFCFPSAKIGSGSFFYIYSSLAGTNYFGFSSFLSAILEA